MNILRRYTDYNFDVKNADETVSILSRTVVFRNQGETLITIDSKLILEAGDSIELGGRENSRVNDNFDIVFTGNGTNNLLVITENENDSFKTP